MQLRYTPTARGFTPGTLSIHVKATDTIWFFGDHIGKSENLRGTTRTLDLTNGFTELAPGLMARNGWGGVANPDTLTLHVFAGADNRFALYEDDGETTDAADPGPRTGRS